MLKVEWWPDLLLHAGPHPAGTVQSLKSSTFPKLYMKRREREKERKKEKEREERNLLKKEKKAAAYN